MHLKRITSVLNPSRADLGKRFLSTFDLSSFPEYEEGKTALKQKRFSNAISLFERVASVCEHSNDTTIYGNALNELAYAQQLGGSWAGELSTRKKVLDVLSKDSRSDWLATDSWARAGLCGLRMNRPDALKTLKEALHLAEEQAARAATLAYLNGMSGLAQVVSGGALDEGIAALDKAAEICSDPAQQQLWMTMKGDVMSNFDTNSDAAEEQLIAACKVTENALAELKIGEHYMRANEPKRGLEHLSTALQLRQSEYGRDSIEVIAVLVNIAKTTYLAENPVTSEGVFRTVVGQLRPHMDSPWHQVLLINALEGYSNLLDSLEFNNKKRDTEIAAMADEREKLERSCTISPVPGASAKNRWWTADPLLFYKWDEESSHQG